MIQIPIGKGDHLAFLVGISPRLISAGGDAALIVLNNGLVLAGGHIPDPNHTLDINVFGFAVNEPRTGENLPAGWKARRKPETGLEDSTNPVFSSLPPLGVS